MLQVSCEIEPQACCELWQQMIPAQKLTDLWDVRECFDRHYRRKLFFVVAREGGQVIGFLPLSWITEKEYYGYFPGEIWQGKTWLEQNRLIARDQDVLEGMLAWLNDQQIPYHLRYLVDSSLSHLVSASVDEIGYLFLPPEIDYSMDNYFSKFSRKSIKTIKKEIQVFKSRGVDFRLDQTDDFELMVKMNIDRFGQTSYFADERFTGSFRELMYFLQRKGWLRIVTAIVAGEPAAVDLGAVYDDVYTLLAGGTHVDYPGIAKVINFFHMERACEMHFKEVDFLCGNFSWKTLFRLSARPLYLLTNLKEIKEEVC